MNIFKSLLGSDSNRISAEETQARIKSKQPPFVLDVRQPEEYQAGHIAGAKIIPLNQLGSRLNDLPRDREIVCVCRSGSRSGAATRQLQAAGYTCFNLSGGMIAWQRAGLPVKTGKAGR
jgi:rhodanese-related sulfurtransferase